MKELFALIWALAKMPLGLYATPNVRPTKHASPTAMAIGLILMTLVVLPVSIYYSGWRGVPGPIAWLFISRMVVKIRWTPILLIAQAIICLVAFPIPAQYDVYLVGWSMAISVVYMLRSANDIREEIVDERFKRKS